MSLPGLNPGEADDVLEPEALPVAVDILAGQASDSLAILVVGECPHRLGVYHVAVASFVHVERSLMVGGPVIYCASPHNGVTIVLII